MKALFILIFITFGTACLRAQVPGNTSDFQLGKGITFTFNDGEQVLNAGGFLQLHGYYIKPEGKQSEGNFGINRAYTHLRGDFLSNKLGLFLQLDLAQPNPILDAWMAYNLDTDFRITIGQKQSFSGTRSLMFYDQTLALANRSLAVNTFFGAGRELGVFIEKRLGFAAMGADLGVAITSGDGMNSFGANATDFDKGGAKYSARATWFPLGFFTKDNELSGSDFYRENDLKIAIGGAYSYNDGASSANGEGHAHFLFYDSKGKEAYPVYQKISVDILLKYRGFTFLSEYTNATASDLDKLHFNADGNSPLLPKQIANYLILGNGYTFQAGYLTPNNWAVDASVSFMAPEWDEATTLINDSSEIAFGVSKYIIDNRFKIQLLNSFTKIKDAQNQSTNNFFTGLNIHLVF
ncbi:MAG: hypothetical protein Q4G08_07690 [Capnocytophaga sp.]|nr:hypothetical protein [Capnocytophaga sp.]